MKIGIYSGTFDPIHDGHILFGETAINKFGLSKVFFLPERRPRRKQGIKAFEHRVNMIKLAVKNNKKLATIILEQPRFTPESTMPIISERFKGSEIYMLMGDDMLDHFIEWPNVGELIKSVKFIIAIRKYDQSHVVKVVKTIQQISGLKLKYELLDDKLSELSSRSIRLAIKKSDNFDGLSPKVINYIKLNKLYSSSVDG